MVGLLMCDDLIFSSRVTGTARAHGLEFSVVRSPADLGNWLRHGKPKCILVDLNLGGLSLDAFTQQLATPRPYLVGFGSHVDTATLQAARDAGFDRVLARSKFVDELETGLAAWCS